MEIKIRKISKNDSKEIFKLRNDKVTRKFSKNQKKLDNSEHKKWFKNIIKFEKNYFYVALFNNKVFGYVRYEKYDLFYKISISLKQPFIKLKLLNFLVRGLAKFLV